MSIQDGIHIHFQSTCPDERGRCASQVRRTRPRNHRLHRHEGVRARGNDLPQILDSLFIVLERRACGATDETNGAKRKASERRRVDSSRRDSPHRVRRESSRQRYVLASVCVQDSRATPQRGKTKIKSSHCHVKHSKKTGQADHVFFGVMQRI